jgi:hypothetical protein
LAFIGASASDPASLRPLRRAAPDHVGRNRADTAEILDHEVFWLHLESKCRTNEACETHHCHRIQDTARQQVGIPIDAAPAIADFLLQELADSTLDVACRPDCISAHVDLLPL